MNYINRLLGDNEDVLIVARRHWLAVLSATVKAIVAIVVLVAAIWAVWRYVGFWQPYLVLVLVAILLWPITTLVVAYLRWSHEVYIVTNFRVIQVDGVFNKNVLDSSLEKVNDVMMRQSFFGRMMDYGDVEILTASEDAINRFDQIAHPIRFKHTMMSAKNELEGTGRSRRASARCGENEERQGSVDEELLSGLVLMKERGLLTEEEFRCKAAELQRRGSQRA